MCSPLASLMSLTTSFAPSSANRLAIAAPKPEPPPVTIATLFSSLTRSSSASFSLYHLNRNSDQATSPPEAALLLDPGGRHHESGSGRRRRLVYRDASGPRAFAGRDFKFCK